MTAPVETAGVPESVPSLRTPKGAFQELVRSLAESAMSVTHHDANETEPGYIREVQTMEQRFTNALRGYLSARSRAARPEATATSASLEAGWRSISSAPRDGTHALFFWPNIPEGARRMGSSTKMHHGVSVGWFEWDEDWEDRPKGWVSPKCGFRMEGDQCLARNQEDCRYWQPLPDTSAAALSPAQEPAPRSVQGAAEGVEAIVDIIRDKVGGSLTFDPATGEGVMQLHLDDAIVAVRAALSAPHREASPDRADVAGVEAAKMVPEDATKPMIDAALNVDWSNEDEIAVAHNVWHAMYAAASIAPADKARRDAEEREDERTEAVPTDPTRSSIPIPEDVRNVVYEVMTRNSFRFMSDYLTVAVLTDRARSRNTEATSHDR